MNTVYTVLVYLLVSPVAFAAEQTQQQHNPLLNMFPLLVMVILFYLFMIRPQQKKHKQMQDMLEALKVGDKVATNSGMIGKIDEINQPDKTVIISFNDGVKVLMYKHAVSNILNDEGSAKDEKTTTKRKK